LREENKLTSNAHPWLDDFEAYEAVLRCTHAIQPWDAGATLRAYQTYGFDAAFTPGNDNSYKHAETGVMVQHDGDVVAACFGDGELKLMFADLFLVLCALGWKKAEVYHPEASMGALLHDMGKAIPAHLDFDVSPADVGQVLGSSRAAQAMVSRGKELVAAMQQGESGHLAFDDIALGELESMGGDEGLPLALPEAGAPTLEASGGIAAHGASLPLVLDDDAPIVPSLGAGARSAEFEADLELPATAEDGPTPRQAAENVLVPSPELEEPADARDGAREVEQVRQQLPAAPAGQAAYAVRTEATAAAAGTSERASWLRVPAKPQLPSVVLLGLNALCFDYPNAPLAATDLEAAAQEVGPSEVVHLSPGLMGQAWRWDALGEASTEAPWAAERLASDLIPDNEEGAAFFALAAATLRRVKERPQVRDVLTSDATDLAPVEALGVVDAGACRRALVGLLATPAGDAFVDLPTPAAGGGQGQGARSFTARQLSESEDGRVFVIHVDATDGQTAERLARALQKTAVRQAGSTRGATLREAARAAARARMAEDAQRTALEARRLEALTKLHGSVAALFDELRALGITPQGQAT
jgi:hypothetical protein